MGLSHFPSWFQDPQLFPISGAERSTEPRAFVTRRTFCGKHPKLSGNHRVRKVLRNNCFPGRNSKGNSIQSKPCHGDHFLHNPRYQSGLNGRAQRAPQARAAAPYPTPPGARSAPGAGSGARRPQRPAAGKASGIPCHWLFLTLGRGGRGNPGGEEFQAKNLSF